METIKNIENRDRALYRKLGKVLADAHSEDTRISIIIRSYSDFMTEKKKGTFKNLKDGMEIYLPKTPLFFAFLTELKLLYDTHGLLAYFLDIREDYIVIALRED